MVNNSQVPKPVGLAWLFGCGPCWRCKDKHKCNNTTPQKIKIKERKKERMKERKGNTYHGSSKGKLVTSISQNQCPDRFLGTIGQNPSVSTSNRLHVVIVLLDFLYWLGVYSIDFPRMKRNFLEILNFKWLFLKFERFICNYIQYDI